MSVKIRLKQTGKRNARMFRIVAIDESKKRDGKVIEELGVVYSLSKVNNFSLNRKRLDFWLAEGARTSATVAKLLEIL